MWHSRSPPILSPQDVRLGGEKPSHPDRNNVSVLPRPGASLLPQFIHDPEAKLEEAIALWE